MTIEAAVQDDIHAKEFTTLFQRTIVEPSSYLVLKKQASSGSVCQVALSFQLKTRQHLGFTLSL